jgi:hypothetical protein
VFEFVGMDVDQSAGGRSRSSIAEDIAQCDARQATQVGLGRQYVREQFDNLL